MRIVAEPPAGLPSSSSEPHEQLPVFGSQQYAEFEASLCPIRIFEHGTLRYLAVNDAAVAFYGYTRDEFLARTITDTRHPDEHPDLMVCRTTGYFRHWGQRRHLKRSGEVVVVESCGQDIWFNGKKARLAMTIDVTERERTVDQLRRREDEFKSLAEHLPDVVARVDRDLRHLYVNPEVAAVTGKPAQEFLGRTSREVGMPAELVELWEGALTGVFEEGKRRRLEFAFDTPSGKRYYESHVVPEREPGGDVRTVLSISRNITKRKQAEQALRASEARLELAIENSGLAMWEWNIETGACWVHRRLSELLGHTPEELPPTLEMWHSLLHPDDAAATRAALDRHIAGETPCYEHEHRLRKKNGEWLWVLARGKIVQRDAAGKPLVMLGGSQDITSQKVAEKERLEQVVRQRDTLIREVNHRIKNNLQGVVSLLRHLAVGQPDSEPLVHKAIAHLQAVAVVHGLQGSTVRNVVLLRDMLPAIAQAVQDITGVKVQTETPADDISFALIAEHEAVPVALVLNELVLNAAKVLARREAGGIVYAVLRVSEGRAHIAISNKGQLPRGFDFERGVGVGTGLELVKSLLAPEGASLTFRQAAGRVEASLELAGPMFIGTGK